MVVDIRLQLHSCVTASDRQIVSPKAFAGASAAQQLCPCLRSTGFLFNSDLQQPFAAQQPSWPSECGQHAILNALDIQTPAHGNPPRVADRMPWSCTPPSYQGRSHQLGVRAARSPSSCQTCLLASIDPLSCSPHGPVLPLDWIRPQRKDLPQQQHVDRAYEAQALICIHYRGAYLSQQPALRPDLVWETLSRNPSTSNQSRASSRLAQSSELASYVADLAQ